MADKLKVLFLCTGNSCRSQMAEGWTRHLKGDQIDVWSAGIERHDLDPRAVKVMAEAGIDISGHTTKHVQDLMHIPFDYVVTVCGPRQGKLPGLSGESQGGAPGFRRPTQPSERCQDGRGSAISVPARP